MAESRPVIAIIGGTGKEGSGLGTRWALAGYPVIIGSRQAQKAEQVAQAINLQLGLASVIGLENGEASRKADISVLTVIFPAHQTILESIKGMLEGKILVDATSRVDYRDPKPPQLPSAAEQAQLILGPMVRVVAAFQNVPAKALASAIDQPVDADVFVCSDDLQAAEQVLELSHAAGLHGYYAGKLANAIIVEGLTSILISINRYYGVKNSSVRISGVSQLTGKR